MTERTSRWGRVGLMAVTLAALGACNTEPNPNFEQQLKDQQAASRGDPYAGLQNLPRQYRYLRAEPSLRQATAAQEALAMRGNYDGLLKKSAALPEIPALSELTQSCRAAFEQASAFQANAAAGAPAAEIFEKLNQCRDGALAAEKSSDETTQARAHLLRRFASAGMTLVGSAAVAQGDEAGLKLWGRGEELAAQDKPEFKMNARMLIGN